MPDSALVFLHLPKTGGTTLRDVIARQFRGGGGFRFDGGAHERAHFAGLSQRERDGFALVEGHMYYGIHEQLTSPSRYITMLREPVERVLSYYSFVLSTPTHYAHTRFRALGNLRGVMERSGNHELDNFQSRLLSGERSIGLPLGHVDRAVLAAAKENLGRFEVVGLTERFEESLALLSIQFGWRDLVYHRFICASGRPKPGDLDPAELELVRRNNALDIELYEHACSLFDQQVLSCGAAFGAALERVRRRQREHELRNTAPLAEPSLRGGIWRL